MGEPRRIIPISPEHALADQEQALYEVRSKIYPRAVTGRFAAARVALVLFTQAVFYGVPWLQWGGRQAVLFDLGARKFYIFGIVFWPQDFIYLTVLLTISALSLFLFTAVAGRLFCGYACPQTVYTEIFLWVERKIEGERMQRMKLDAARLTTSKVLRKAAKHGVWGAIALWTGITFVGYFTPITMLLHEIGALSLSGWQTFWIGFYSFATYGNAGWMREQVCKYMCPYARFQSVMFDPDTLIVTYDGKRGEPRGARSRKVDPAAAGLGHCVDCEICVQVCPTGIDIRKGLQYECIGCAACIDACDQVMTRMDYPPGLIRYATQNSLAQNYDLRQAARRVLRPRVLAYTAILCALIIATGAILDASAATRGCNPRSDDIGTRDRRRADRERVPAATDEFERGCAARNGAGDRTQWFDGVPRTGADIDSRFVFAHRSDPFASAGTCRQGWVAPHRIRDSSG